MIQSKKPISTRRYGVKNKVASSTRRWDEWHWPLAFVIFIAIAIIVYLPGLSGGFVWDDDNYVFDNYQLRSVGGLWRIWTQLGAVAQYYPAVFTSFWLEYHLWKLWAPGYHKVNVFIHGCNAALLYLFLRKLKPALAFPVALLFVAHPVMVESVQWITERKNTLSMAFYMAALLTMYPITLHNAADSNNSLSRNTSEHLTTAKYLAGLGLFILAMFSKTTACTLPATILVLTFL